MDHEPALAALGREQARRALGKTEQHRERRRYRLVGTGDVDATGGDRFGCAEGGFRFGEGLTRRRPGVDLGDDRGGHGAGAVESAALGQIALRSEEHTSELQSLMRISYAVFCLKKKKNHNERNKKN